MRIGIGFDIHALESGRKFILGGVEIPFDKGPVAHSDGDVLIHSICDALLGAACLGDIGIHFPDNDQTFKNIDSRILLEKTIELIHSKGFRVMNIDSTICLQLPKISRYTADMRQILSDIIGIGPERLSIKATTTEKLGAIGRGEGVSAQAIVLLDENS